MTIISIILGAIMIIVGMSCAFNPGATFLQAGFLISIFMLVYGILGIIRVFKKQSGILDAVISVLALIVGVCAIIKPGTTLAVDIMIIYMTAAWFTLRGIFEIILAFSVKNINRNWIWELILGILSLVVGIYSFAHPTVMALAIGLLIGFYFITTGIDLIVMAVAVNKIIKE
ncbi:MAG: DUF308 domain-containing protein [Lachnospiraceae bacterium]|nr:DUF308 domain-containing protein [Lachnospiraceae bacterium]